MTNIQNKIKKINGSNAAKKSLLLDTLAQSVTRSNKDDFGHLESLVTTDSIAPLRKRARRKYFTSKLIPILADCAEHRGDDDMKKAYWNSFHCCKNAYIRMDGTVLSEYCKNRWCLVCAAIKTATVINKYSPVIETWKDKQFLTLTQRTCFGYELPDKIVEMNRILRNIVVSQKMRMRRGKSDWKIIAIKKFECVYSPITNKFNPHFHLIVKTKQMAEYMRDTWIEKNQLAGVGGQDIRVCIAGTEKELFKYETKVITSSKSGGRTIYAAPLDWIYTCVRRKRTFDRIGFSLSDDFVVSNVMNTIPVISRSEWDVYDWVNKEDGALLSGYRPSKGFTDLLDNNILPF